MRRNFRKNIFSLLASGILTAQIFSPALVLAQGTRGSLPSVKSTADICSKLSEYESKIDQSTGARLKNLSSVRDDRDKKVIGAREKRTQRLAENRIRWDENRKEQYAKMQEFAKDSLQKQAVAAFVRAIDDAISIRRAAIDKALNDFNAGFQQTKAANDSVVNTAITAYRNAIKAAFDRAKTDCASGIDQKTIRQNLQSDLKATRENFQQDKQSIQKPSATLESLVAARKAAIQKAVSDFQAAVEKARSDFKAAIAKDTGGKATSTNE